MAIFKQRSNDEWRRKRSEEQLAMGGLPLDAEWRLRRLRENGRLFTSNLSVNELALAGSLGIRPLGQVTGCSIYHIGWRPRPMAVTTELIALTTAHNQARRLALARLQKEAQTLGARAVLGVQMRLQAAGGFDAVLEVVASGTAVGWHDSQPPTIPFLCGLSGQEVHSLRRIGYRPLGLALGVCVYCQIGSRGTTWATGSKLLSRDAWTNQELTDYTHGARSARQLAVERLEGEATSYRAEGVIGVGIEARLEMRDVEIEIGEGETRERRDLIVHAVALGTAIAPFTEHVPAVHYALPLGA